MEKKIKGNFKLMLTIAVIGLFIITAFSVVATQLDDMGEISSEQSDAYASHSRGGRLPRPKWDSGWIPIEPGEYMTITHDIGINVDNYVVDMQFKDLEDGYGINNKDHGGCNYNDKGAYWMDLTTENITLHRKDSDNLADEVRVRIWIHK